MATSLGHSALPVSVRTAAGAAHSVDWRARLSRRIWVTDLIVIGVAVFGAQLVWFEGFSETVVIRPESGVSSFSYSVMGVVLVAAWMWALALNDSRASRVIGSGISEYRRVADASLRVFGLVAIIAFVLRVDIARGYLLISLPLGLALLLGSRLWWRHWLIRQRRAGLYTARVLLVGSERSVTDLSRELLRTPGSGYSVVGACVPAGHVGARLGGTDIPILGSVDDVERALRATDADTVAVTSTDELPPAKVKRISWSLETGQQHLVLAPGIVDIAGPRIHAVPLAGLPLIQVEIPRLTAGQRVVKRATDVVGAAVGLLILSPVLLVLTVLVRRSGPGPVLFRQERVGLHGRPFRMLKFRTMVEDAETRLGALPGAGSTGVGNEVLFKLREDPRVTPIGRFMRRYSLDELPQLMNVLMGSMALVGPRPPLRREVDHYTDHVHRRFLMKPGITGIWQVSGRSTLSWEDSVRLDLSYVENYSLIGDVAILLRTVKAVFMPGDTAH